MAFGLTPQGFEIMRQQDIISAINQQLQATFGQNINLGAESVLGQIVGIFSEREALIWELIEAVYVSQYPAGAEGTSVDNILALNNLRRLAATPTKTAADPVTFSNGITLYGLVLRGTAGTVIPSGSIIQTTATPPLQFTTDNNLTISAATNAVQSLFFNNTPTMGSFTATISPPVAVQADPSNPAYSLTTANIQWDALSNQTFYSFGATPGTGQYAINLFLAGVSYLTSLLNYNAPATGGGSVQAAIQGLGAPFTSVTVSGSYTSGFTISWGAAPNPITTFASNTTLQTISAIDSVQSAFNNLEDTTAMPNNYPFTDATVSGSFIALSFSVTFGGGSVAPGEPPSGDQPLALMSTTTFSLQMASTVTNVQPSNTIAGAPAQAVGSATALVTGPNSVSAGSLTVIGTPVSGWSSVDNQLDCATGTNTEDDTQALTRRSTLLAAQGNGPLQSIIEKVSLVPGVSSALGFQNLTDAALQTVSFSVGPSSLISGSFTIVINGHSASIPYTATAATVQTAIRALPGYSTALVTGNFQYGFVIDFNGSNGGQPQQLSLISSNTLMTAGGAVGITVNFTRPGHSVEIVAEQGVDTSDAEVATAIYSALPAGIQSYGTIEIVGTYVSGNNYLTMSETPPTDLQQGAFVLAGGVPTGTRVTTISGNQVNLSANVVSNGTDVPIFFTFSTLISDAFGNQYQIGFSKPTLVPIYVTLVLITDPTKFQASSIQTIISDLIAIGQAVPIGGLIIGFGTQGLVGSFNSVPGIIGYTLYFGTNPNPLTNTNIQLLPEQLSVWESIAINVSYS
jgi:uncharacterized phage protein gp47/JayE